MVADIYLASLINLCVCEVMVFLKVGTVAPLLL